MSEISCEKVKALGVLSESTKGWKKEVNMISWNGRKAKLDIRDWNTDDGKTGKGVTLSKEEVQKLKVLLDSVNIEELFA